MPIIRSDRGRLTSGRENFLWLVADKCLRIVAGVAVGMLVTRYLGPESFGLLAYATSVVVLLLPMAELGIEAVMRRKLITAPEDTAQLLGTAWRLRLAAGISLNAALATWLAVFPSGVDETRLILITGLTLLQPAGSTAESWLQANLLARRATIASWLALAAGAVARLHLVSIGAGLVSFAWVAVGEGALNCLLVWTVARKAGLPKLPSGAGLVPWRELMAESWPLLLAGLTVSLYMRIDLVMLRQMTGVHAAGSMLPPCGSANSGISCLARSPPASCRAC